MAGASASQPIRQTEPEDDQDERLHFALSESRQGLVRETGVEKEGSGNYGA